MHGEAGWGLEESHCELGPAHLTSCGDLLPGLELRLGVEYLCVKKCLTRLQSLRSKLVGEHLGGQGVCMPETLGCSQRGTGGDPIGWGPGFSEVGGAS